MLSGYLARTSAARYRWNKSRTWLRFMRSNLENFRRAGLGMPNSKAGAKGAQSVERVVQGTLFSERILQRVQFALATNDHAFRADDTLPDPAAVGFKNSIPVGEIPGLVAIRARR